MLSGETFLEAFAKLKNHGAWTLVCHEHPDGDTLGSAFALYSLAKRCGKRAAIVSNDPLPRRALSLRVLCSLRWI